MTEQAPTPSVPPSEPRPSSRPGSSAVDLAERPMRLQLGLAMGLALVLVMVPLYLWRRPRADSDPIRIAQASATASTPVVSLQAQPSTAAGVGSGSAPGAPGKDVGLGPARVVSCHDPGSKKTKPEACDHLETFDLAFAKALQESSGCAEDKSSYVLTYVADVSFARKKNPITLSATKDGHTVRASKGTYGPCVAQIKKKLEAVNLEGVKHEHSRYKVEIVATYPASGKP